MLSSPKEPVRVLPDYVGTIRLWLVYPRNRPPRSTSISLDRIGRSWLD